MKKRVDKRFEPECKVRRCGYGPDSVLHRPVEACDEEPDCPNPAAHHDYEAPEPTDG